VEVPVLRTDATNTLRIQEDEVVERPLAKGTIEPFDVRRGIGRPVVCQNQIVRESRGIPVVVLQDPTEPLPALDRPIGVGVDG